MRNIVVTTDLSSESKAAFPVAKSIAKAFGAELHVVAVVEDPAQSMLLYSIDFPVFPSPDIQNQLAEKVKQELEGVVKSLCSDIKYSLNVIRASLPVSAEIVKFADARGADLIVMATHGRSGLSRVVIGSVTERLLRESKCPVLAVPVRKQ